MYNSIVDTLCKNRGHQRQFGAQPQTAKPFRAKRGMAIDSCHEFHELTRTTTEMAKIRAENPLLQS
jgi:predicted homoserine dehydrogenase-like protein